jgi:hypothetical protein
MRFALSTVTILLALLALPGQAHTTAPADGTLTLEPCTLINGQFDAGLAGWETDETSTEDPATGRPAPSRQLSGWSYTSLSQPLRLATGDQATVSIWARSASTGTLIIDRILLDVYDEHPATWPPIHTAVWPVTLDAEWHQYSTTFTPSDAITHTLTLRIQTSGNKDDPAPGDIYLLWFDAIEVTCGQLPYSYYLPLLVK